MRALIGLTALLLCGVPTATTTAEECWYFPKGADDELRQADCLRPIAVGNQREPKADAMVVRKVARALSYDTDGLAAVRSSSGFYYVNRSRAARSTVNFDNGPDPLSGGLARTRRGGKIGYFDASLRIVIEPQFDFGFPFEGDLAIVCNGCVRTLDGEHDVMTGGLWGAIDRAGRIVQPIQFDRDELRRRIAR